MSLVLSFCQTDLALTPFVLFTDILDKVFCGLVTVNDATERCVDGSSERRRPQQGPVKFPVNRVAIRAKKGLDFGRPPFYSHHQSEHSLRTRDTIYMST